MLRRLPIAIAASLLLAGAASAQPGPPPGPRPGGPPSGERHGGPSGAGDRLFISPSGEPFRTENGLVEWLTAADADHDGALTLTEFRADAMRFFKVLDLNSDGWVDGPENSNYERKIAPEITQMGFGGPSGPRGEDGKRKPFISKTSKRQEPRQGAARFSLLNEAQPVRGADFDLNQRVSAEEWAKMATRRFALLDPEGLGKLTAAGLTHRLP